MVRRSNDALLFSMFFSILIAPRVSIYIYWICSGSLVGITMNQSYAILLFTKKKVAPTDPYRHGKMASTRETHCNFRNPKIARMPFKSSWCGCHLTVKLYKLVYRDDTICIYADYPGASCPTSSE